MLSSIYETLYGWSSGLFATSVPEIVIFALGGVVLGGMFLALLSVWIGQMFFCKCKESETHYSTGLFAGPVMERNPDCFFHGNN